MSPVSITLQFTSVAEAAAALARMSADATGAATRVIDPADRPDAGTPVSPVLGLPPLPVPPRDDPAAVFGVTYVAQTAPAAPAVASVPGPLAPALFSAAVAPSPTAPAAPTAGALIAPPAPSPVAPNPVLAAPAPTAPATPAVPAPAGAIQLDGRGLPWDRRIHSETKSTNADGSWRRKRGTADTYAASVESELRQAMAAGPAPVAAPVAAPPVPVPGAPVAPQAPATMPATFGELMAAVEPAISSGKLTNLAVATALGKVGLANWFQLAARPDLVPVVAADVMAVVWE